MSDESVKVGDHIFQVDVKSLEDGDLLIIRAENPTATFCKNVQESIKRSILDDAGVAVTVLVCPDDIDIERIPHDFAKHLLTELIRKHEGM